MRPLPFAVRHEDQPAASKASLPRPRAQAAAFWARIRQLQVEDVTVTVTVTEATRGGLIVKYGPYDGFVPIKQFGSVRATTQSAALPDALASCAASVLLPS